MCFSTNASFITSGLLVLSGAASLYYTDKKSWRFLAATPLFFAVQQALEGCLWLALMGRAPHSIVPIATIGYLFFAHVFWPFWIPFVLTIIEEKNVRKGLLSLPLLLGSAVSLVSLYALIQYKFIAAIDHNHIVYSSLGENSYYATTLYPYIKLGYLIAVLSPFFISSIRGMALLGGAVAIAYMVSELWYRYYLTSIWCFFAAVLSAGILIIILYNRRKRRKIDA